MLPNSHDQMSAANVSDGSIGEIDSIVSTGTSRPRYGRSVSVHTPTDHLDSSSVAEPLLDNQMTTSIDMLALTDSGGTLRKKGKGSRLSIPMAFNNASDKIFGKRRSNDNFKLKHNGESEKKDRKTFKDLFGIKKSMSRDKLKELSQSTESGIDYVGFVELPRSPELPTSPGRADFEPLSQPSSPLETLESEGENNFSFTPMKEKPTDLGLPAICDVPPADLQGDDSLLYTEAPTRSFPLSNTSLPHRVHGDMYDTAFALTSLKGDGGSAAAVTGLQYLNKVHSVVNTAFVSSSAATSATNTGSDRLAPAEGKPMHCGCVMCLQMLVL